MTATETDKGSYIGEEMARILRAGVAAVKKDADRFDMGHWLRRGDILSYEELKSFLLYHSDCGTTLCYGSFLLETAPAEFFTDSLPHDIRGAATMYAGLNYRQADLLFCLIAWPPAYQELYSGAKTPDEFAAALEQRVEHFIRTGE